MYVMCMYLVTLEKNSRDECTLSGTRLEIQGQKWIDLKVGHSCLTLNTHWLGWCPL